MLDLLMGILSGGATGILGLGLQSLFGYLNKRADHARELALKKVDLDIAKSEADADVKIAQTEADGARDVQDGLTQAASYDMEPKRFATGERPSGWLGNFGWLLMTLLDALRGSIRPLLTIWLALEARDMKNQGEAILLKMSTDNLNLHAQVLTGTYEHIIWTLCYLFSTCVTWWFGSRMKHTFGGKQ